jgi:hypothetical protein
MADSIYESPEGPRHDYLRHQPARALLAVYSFLGWIVEVLFVLVTMQKLENRGFLTGPFLPIYGIGAVLLVVLVIPYVTCSLTTSASPSRTPT